MRHRLQSAGTFPNQDQHENNQPQLHYAGCWRSREWFFLFPKPNCVKNNPTAFWARDFCLQFKVCLRFAFKSVKQAFYKKKKKQSIQLASGARVAVAHFFPPSRPSPSSSSESKQAKAAKCTTTSVNWPVVCVCDQRSCLPNFCETHQRDWNFFFTQLICKKLWHHSCEARPRVSSSLRKMWTSRLMGNFDRAANFDEPNCPAAAAALPCYSLLFVFAENKPGTLDSNCVVCLKVFLREAELCSLRV